MPFFDSRCRGERPAFEVLFLLASLTFLVLACTDVARARTDPETNRVRVIFLGEVKPISFPFPDWISSEPKFTLQPVPCDIEWFSEAEARRFTRIYLPRTYQGLVDRYDAIIFEDFTSRVLPPGTLEMFQRGIDEEGLGIVLVEYVYWSGNLNEIEIWIDSIFYDVFPAEPVIGAATNQGRQFYEILRREPIFGIPDVSRWAMNGASHGDLIAREGALVHAIWKVRRTEAVVSREYGRGQALQIAHGWDNTPSETVTGYEYLPDLIYNELFFVSNVPPPENLALVHVLRTDLIQIGQRRESAVALIDFVNRFGANTARLDRMLSDIDDLVSKAEQEYITSEYEEALDTVSEIVMGFGNFGETALEVKERALLWIYVIEWVSVMATLMICLQVLWILMIRRRLYRYVGTTKGAKHPGCGEAS